MNTKVATVEAFEGHAVEVVGDDGYPLGIVIPKVEAVTSDGRHFALPNGLDQKFDDEGFGGYVLRYSLDKARAIRDVIIARGFIVEDHWVEFDPDTRSLEGKASDDYEAEVLGRLAGGSA
jgi:hypothetical protein